MQKNMRWQITQPLAESSASCFKEGHLSIHSWSPQKQKVNKYIKLFVTSGGIKIGIVIRERGYLKMCTGKLYTL